ncbi:MAG TPA: nucleoside kinase [Tenericutes bacterium]|nr:nucleoside kinase [Mycoplasmatota bacterium]
MEKIDKTIEISFRGKDKKSFPMYTSLLEISKNYQKHFNYPIMVAKVDNEIYELDKTIDKDCNIDFFDRSSAIGNNVYSKSVQFLLIVAVRKVLGSGAKVIIQHSIDKGIYCEIEGISLDQPKLNMIEETMQHMVKRDYIITKLKVDRLDAIKYFKKENMLDKMKVLKYTSNTLINLHRLDDVYDYFFSELAYSTKDLDSFKLTYIKDNGFVLLYPNIYNPDLILDYQHREKVFNEFSKYTKWGKTIGINNASDLNEFVSQGKYTDIIRLSEVYYESQLSRIADKIYDNKDNIKIILLAGPSSSGKTTTSKKLEVYLQAKGYKTHTISVDDYFLEKEETPLDEYGEKDFESIRAIDISLFNDHMTKLLNGEKVLLPQYNFITGKKEYKKRWLEIKEGDIIIIEGLHALNDELTLSIDRNLKYKIYISPLTQLNIDDHNRIHTSDTRRLRRIIRDNRSRGYNASDTLKMWPRIRRGEEKYIYPYQEDIDAVINSSLIYEIGVLKVYAEPLLYSVPEDDESYEEAIRLINLLRNFLPIPSDDISKDSVLREFIGGSSFKE